MSKKSRALYLFHITQEGKKYSLSIAHTIKIESEFLEKAIDEKTKRKTKIWAIGNNVYVTWNHNTVTAWKFNQKKKAPKKKRKHHKKKKRNKKNKSQVGEDGEQWIKKSQVPSTIPTPSRSKKSSTPGTPMNNPKVNVPNTSMNKAEVENMFLGTETTNVEENTETTEITTPTQA